jgi:hypothetical protein
MSRESRRVIDVDDAARRITQADAARAEAQNELGTLQSLRAVRIGLAVSESISQRDIRHLPSRLSKALRRVEAPGLQHPTGFNEVVADLPSTADGMALFERPSLAPYGFLRILNRGGSNPFSDIASSVDAKDYVDIVIVSPGTAAAPLLEAGEPTHPSAEAAPAVAFIPTLEALPLGQESDLIVTDDDHVADEAACLYGPERVLRLDPSIDMTRSNPVGFERAPAGGLCVFVERGCDDIDTVVELTNRDPSITVVAEPGTTLPEGVKAEHIDSNLWQSHAQKHFAVVVDRRLHRSTASFAEHTLGVAAAGTLVGTAPDEMLERLLPRFTLTRDTSWTSTIERIDLLDRERMSVAARRHVFANHERVRRFEKILKRLDIPLRSVPLVTILLATKRPERLAAVYAHIASQSYTNLELVTVLHGGGFDDAAVQSLGDALEIPVTVIHAPALWQLGDCLNAALESANGELVTKMDDDDAYGPEHIADLVTAYEFSGAEIVGRAPDFVFLADRAETLMIDTGLAERYGHHVAGPTMLLSRDLARLLRFERRSHAVDQSLYDRAIAAGCRIYATSPFEFVLYRGHGDHTWDAKDSDFVTASIRQWDGPVPTVTNIDNSESAE